MKVSYNWLKEYISLDLTPLQLAERLTMAGLEVESVEEVGREWEDIKVGSVVSKRRHPQLDHLSICQVEVAEERLSVVCGAPNVREGQKVAVAPAGTRLPDGTVIRKRKFRGVESQGMICSEAELGLGEDSAGIMVLPADSPVGRSLAEALGLVDYVLDLEVTPNRPDWMSVVGVAREVGAITGSSLKRLDYTLKEGSSRIEEFASVEIEDSQGCPRYSARVLTDVQIAVSPLWLRRRLENAGLRPINNVVDVTNYVLLELGQPLHAFDLEKIRGHRIIVRRARQSEGIVTLDSIPRQLGPEILVIADRERPIALAGIMGGSNTEVSERTTTVLLESAYFDPKVVRKGAKSLGVSTEASQRFERGADYNATVRALDRAAALIAELGAAAIVPGVIDACPKRLVPPTLKLRTERVTKVLGVEIPGQQVERILRSLECEVSRDDSALLVSPPSFRPDLTREIDLIEEVARIFGYDRIPAADRASGSLGVEQSPQHLLLERLRGLLMASGLTEVVTSSLVAPEVLQTVEPDIKLVCLSNPASREMSALRSTLVPGLLEVVCRNLNRKAQAVKIFEIGKIFFAAGNSTTEERLQVGGALTGERREFHWGQRDCQVDFFDMKGILETVVEEITSCRPSVRSYCSPCYQQGEAAQILLGGDTLGVFGRVAHQVLSRFQIKRPVYIFTLEFDSLLRHWQRERKFRPLPLYPAAQRDIAVVVDEQVETGQIVQAIGAVNPRLIESVELFDVYKGDQIPKGKKSLAFALTFRSAEATLSEAKVEKLFQKIVEKLNREFDAQLRS